MKYLKWFLISSFLILFLGVCNVVSALELTNIYVTQDMITYDKSINGYYLKNDVNINANNNLNFDLTGVNINGYDYMQFNLFYNYLNQQTYNTGGTQTFTGNIYECTYWNLKEMTYADGTKSQYYVCEEYTASGTQPTSEQTTTYFNNQIGIEISLLLDNNYWTICTIQNGLAGITQVECPLPSNRTQINRIRIRTLSNKVTYTMKASIGVANQFIFYKDPVNSMTQKQDETNNQLQDMNDNITSTDITGASQGQNNIVNNSAFQDNTGLSGIITAPLTMISSLTNQCQPIQITLPYLKNTNLTIPCMGNFLQNKIPSLVIIVKVIVNGFICYLIGLDLFKIVKNARDPDNDRIEVLDL